MVENFFLQHSQMFSSLLFIWLREFGIIIELIGIIILGEFGIIEFGIIIESVGIIKFVLELSEINLINFIHSFFFILIWYSKSFFLQIVSYN